MRTKVFPGVSSFYAGFPWGENNFLRKSRRKICSFFAQYEQFCIFYLRTVHMCT